ncbi:ATP-binding protein [Thioclava nitratireducens]|uniref:ATP-binding protein n=1 Tax=Thioclava nitratireducens TaxID=1915078 RepID=UPI00247FDBB2|nr:ATP-binding protein [Thioclava nitratireducens]WGT51388.1 ATP-binding protein [Thioclava nitratireducens]
MIDTTPFTGAIAEIPLDGNTLITGQNAAGKTSVIQLMPLFLGVPPSKISDKTQGKDFYRYYVPRASSYIAFEYQHRDGYPRSVIIHSALSDDKLVFRFVRSALYEDMFVTENGDFVSSDNLASHLRNRGYNVASQQVDTILDYRTIILGLKVDHGDPKRRKFLAQMITEYTISQLNKPLRNADQVIHAMLTRDVSLKAIESMLADKLLAGDPDLQVEGDRSNIENWPMQYRSYREVMEYEPKARELQRQSKELIGEKARRIAAIRELTHLERGLSETERETEKQKNAAAAKYEAEQSTFTEEARNAQRAREEANSQLQSTNDKIDEIEKRHAQLVKKDAEGKARLAERKEEIEDDLREAESRYNALAGEQRALTAHYDQLKGEADKSGELRIQRLYDADEALRKVAQGKTKEAEARHIEQERELTSSFEPSILEADAQVDKANGDLGAAREAGRNPSPSQDVLDQQDEAAAAVAEVNSLLFAEADELKRLEKSAQSAKDSRQKANQRLGNLVSRIKTLSDKLDHLKASRKPAPGSLLAFLREHREDWGDTIGKVINPELLSNVDLSPEMIDDTSSLFGLQVDLDRLVPCDQADLSNIDAAIDEVRAELEEEVNEQTSLEAELRNLGRALTDAEHAVTLKETEIEALKRRRTAATETHDARKADVAKARLTAKRDAEERIKVAQTTLETARTKRSELIKEKDGAVAAMRTRHREELGQITALRDQDVEKNERKRRDIRDEIADRKDELEKELKAALAAKGIDTRLLEEIQVRISAATSDLAEIRANEDLVAEWKYVTREKLPLLPELRSRRELQARECERLEAVRRAIVDNWQKRHDELTDQITALQAKLTQCEKDKKRIAQRLGAIDPNEIAMIAPAETTVRKLDELINDLNDADRAVGKLSEKLRQGVLLISRVFQREPHSPAAQHLATAKEGFSSTYEGPEWVPAFIEWYDELHTQQRAQLLHDASIVGNSIKSGYQRLMSLEQQIQAENRTLQSHLNDNNFMTVVEDLRVSIKSTIRELEFMPAMKRLRDLHEAWISQPHDTDPPEGYSEAMTDLLRFWNARNGISANLRDQIRIEGHIIEKGNQKKFNARTDMKNLSSNGVSYLIMTTIMVAFVNIVRGRSPVRFIWALDELSNIDEGNTRKLLEMLDRNQINMIAATPSAMGNVNALFDYRVKLLNNGQLADVRGAGRKSQRLLPCPVSKRQEV